MLMTLRAAYGPGGKQLELQALDGRLKLARSRAH